MLYVEGNATLDEGPEDAIDVGKLWWPQQKEYVQVLQGCIRLIKVEEIEIDRVNRNRHRRKWRAYIANACQDLAIGAIG